MPVIVVKETLRAMVLLRSYVCLASLSLLASCWRTDAQPQQQGSRLVAIRNVSVIPMDSERVLPAQTVLVRDGLIAAIGPVSALSISAGAHTIDGSGRYLIPGLTDFHVHVRDPSELLSYLAYGVTTVVQLSGGTGNVPDVLALRGRVARGELPGPTIYTTGRMLDGEPPVFPGVSTPVSTPEDARRIVEAQLAAGVDFIKVYNNLSTDAMRAAIGAAHARNTAVIGHIPRRAGRAQALQEALDAHLDVIAHSEEYFFTFFYGDVERQLHDGLVPSPDERRIPETVRLTREAGALVTPNLSFVVMTRTQLDDLEKVLADPEAFPHTRGREPLEAAEPDDSTRSGPVRPSRTGETAFRAATHFRVE